MKKISLGNLNLHTEILETHITDSTSMISSVQQDSRLVRKDSCFTAFSGLHTDGHRFIPQACKAEAALIIHEQAFQDDWLSHSPHTNFIRVADSRRAFSAIAAQLYDYPAESLPIIGVTGTDGKSTTVSLLHQLLQAAGVRNGYISTVSMHDGKQEKKNHLRQSTPEADEIHSMLRQMIDNGCRCAIVEATSHGLSDKTARLADVPFRIGIITNITHEHLEFHGNFEQYRHDKSKLFHKLVDTQAAAIINADDKNCLSMLDILPPSVQAYTYSIQSTSADYYAKITQTGPEGSDFTLYGPKKVAQPVHTRLAGEVNVANILAASLAAAHFLQSPQETILGYIPQLHGPKGRMMPISCGQDFSVFVDYAHTPGSFSKILPMMKGITSGKLIVVFGSAGERDKEKRAMQGEIASQYADIIILTNEDPRAEDPQAILNDIASGIAQKKAEKSVYLIPDRRMAIQTAFQLSQKNDLVLLLGKGHEGTIQFATHSLDWDEAKIAKVLLHEMLTNKQQNETT
jgi:UDP-N-acetylmuramoyl-L-alanyl-D-glutamate--2,6-diaminopimelate ligase